MIDFEDILTRGVENAVAGEVLAARLGLTARQLRREVAEARRQGVPVLSSFDGKRGGYYLPREGEAGREDVYRFWRRHYARATRSISEIHALGVSLGIPAGQMRIEEDNLIG